MNKQEESVYNWLMEKPGYLQRSMLNIFMKYHKDVKGKTRLNKEEFFKVFGVARKDYKSGAKVIGSKKNKRLLEVEKQASKGSSLIVYNPKNKTINLFPEKTEFAKNFLNSTRNRFTPGTYFVTGCSHAPWHNKKMYESIFKYLKKEVDLQGLILAGDIVDLNSLSAHDKGKISIQGVTLDWEYKEANKFLDQFDELKIKGTKDYIFGNHEDRYNRVVKDSDVAKYGEALKSPMEGLNLLKRGYNVYKDWKNDAIHLGTHLDICHGEFLNVHTAKKTIDTYRKSVLYFHTHRFQIYVEGLVGGFNMGFGGDVNAPIFNYATRAMKNSWVNSSALVTLDEHGYYHVEPLMWIGNKLIVSGKQY